MRNHRYFWALAAALLASCADYDVPDEVQFGEAVYTQPEPGFDFKGLASYYLDTTAKVYEDDPNIPSLIDLTDPQYTSIVSAIHANMQGLGYAKLDALPAAGTAGATVLRLAVAKGQGTYWYGGYWCDPYYYYWCYYDWYYAGTYRYGTVMVSMSDLSAPATGTNNVQIRWIAAMYGVSTSAGTTPSANDIARITDAINRSFSQSTYLDTH